MVTGKIHRNAGGGRMVQVHYTDSGRLFPARLLLNPRFQRNLVRNLQPCVFRDTFDKDQGECRDCLCKGVDTNPEIRCRARPSPKLKLHVLFWGGPLPSSIRHQVFSS